MATLISVYNNETCIARCDAHCYNATTPISNCDCICGGVNHGAGFQKALTNTKYYAEQWIERYKKEKNLPNATGTIGPELIQLKLF